jgi:ABC-type uncharacterized transport system substrate-binding protein
MLRRSLQMLFLVLLFYAGAIMDTDAAEPGSRRNKVLVLHSYHQGLQWTDEISRGIKQVFGPHEGEIELYYEYLDTKRNYGKEYLDTLYALHAAKLENIRFSVIIVADNNALSFALAHGRSLYGDVPLVFCGINNYSPAMLNHRTDVTGVVERTAYGETIDLIRRLHPDRTQIWLVVDQTVTGNAMVAELQPILSRYSGDIQFTFYRDFLLSDVPRDLGRLGSKDVVYLLAFNRDADDHFISYTEGIEMIRRSVGVPVYGSWDFYLGKGILGGVITAGAEQGRSAAQMALKILKGQHPSDIPVDTSSAVMSMFDYRELDRFQVNLDKLPGKAVILHRPPGIVGRYRQYAVSALAIALVVMGGLCWRLMRMRRRQRELARMNTVLDRRVQERTAALEMEKFRLEETLSKVTTLEGLLPICASCKKIRDDSGYWNQIESYISNHSDAVFSHGVCPDCIKTLYPDLDLPDNELN